jgi:fused signal recognition particle receptor
MSIFTSLSKALKKTRRIFDGAGNAKNIEELESILLQADVGVKSTQFILAEIQKQNVKGQNYKEALAGILKNILNVPNPQPLNPKSQIIMIVGIPGSGKTTTIAKLANFWQKQGKKVIISASDTYRAAAANQLNIWAKRIGVEIVYSEKGQDAGAITYDTIQKAQSGNFEVVLIDTAGRLHTRKDLMEEAKKIKRVCQKFRPDAPDEIWLILDATIGQNSIEQAKTFNQELQLTGAIVTKLDGTAKGGVIIPIKKELGLPVRFLGIGENAEDLEEFDAEKFIQALLDNS